MIPLLGHIAILETLAWFSLIAAFVKERRKPQGPVPAVLLLSFVYGLTLFWDAPGRFRDCFVILLLVVLILFLSGAAEVRFPLRLLFAFGVGFPLAGVLSLCIAGTRPVLVLTVLTILKAATSIVGMACLSRLLGKGDEAASTPSRLLAVGILLFGEFCTSLPFERNPAFLAVQALVFSGLLIFAALRLKDFLDALSGSIPEAGVLKEWSTLESLEERLLEQNRHLTGAFMAAGALHDLRSLLHRIGLLVDAGIAASDGSARELLERIRQTVDEDGAQILEILGFYKDGDGRIPLDQAIQSIVPQLDRLARDKKIALRVHCSPGLPALLPRQTTIQIAVNLVRNAVEAIANHSGIPRRIRLNAFRSSSWVCLEVQDNGNPLDTGVLRSLGQPVQSTKGGAGLGLFITRRLAECAGGELFFYSRKGGNVFGVRFPPERMT